MAIPALLIGAGVVGVMWATSKGSDGKPPDAKVNPATATGPGGTAGTTGTTGDLDAIAALAGGSQPVDASQMPANTGNPAQTTTTTTTDTGAVQQTTGTDAGGMTGTGTSPTTAPSYSGPATIGATPTEPAAPTLKVASVQAGFVSQYGAAATKTDQSTYYQQQAAAGTIIY